MVCVTSTFTALLKTQRHLLESILYYWKFQFVCLLHHFVGKIIILIVN